MEIRLVLAMDVIRKRQLTRSNVKNTFLQNGTAERDVYSRPLRDAEKKQHYRFLFAATYVLVKANSKYQLQAND